MVRRIGEELNPLVEILRGRDWWSRLSLTLLLALESMEVKLMRSIFLTKFSPLLWGWEA